MGLGSGLSSVLWCFFASPFCTSRLVATVSVTSVNSKVVVVVDFIFLIISGSAAPFIIYLSVVVVVSR